MRAERGKLRERQGITIAHVHHQMADNALLLNMLLYLGHYYKLNEFLPVTGKRATKGKLRKKVHRKCTHAFLTANS